MKQIVLLMLSLLLSIGLWSQTVPQGIPFQGVARDLAGQVIGEKELDVRIRLQNNNESVVGLLYEEYHQIQTNHLGLFQLVVGQGRSSATDFSTIPWSREEIWLELSIRESDNGGDYEVLSHSQLLSVPYAMHAGSADRVEGADADSFASPFWRTNGNNGSLPQFQFIGTVDAKDLNFRTSNQNRLKIQSGGDIEIQMSLDVAHDLVVNGNSIIEGDLNVNGVLYGDGSGLTNIDVNDGDADSTNEIELPTTGNVGDMAYWNGTAWVSIPPGTVGQVLTIGAGGLPAWVDNNNGTDTGTGGTGPSELQIGDTWAGGIIFYLAGPGEDLNGDGIADQGLVATASDLSPSSEWGCYGTAISGADGTAVGTGKQNTDDILAGCSESNIAAKICADYSVTTGGITYDDWFLPSKYELNLMFTNLYLNSIGGFAASWYWSSSEWNNSVDVAWQQEFNNGDQGGQLQDLKGHVRAVRVF